MHHRLAGIDSVGGPPTRALFEPGRDTTASYWAYRGIDVFGSAVAFLGVFPMACGLWLAAGNRLATWAAIPLTCSWSAVLGLGAEALFKRIFGRMPPETFLESQDYGFRLLHGSRIAEAFPSGTAIFSVAIATVLWIAVPRPPNGGNECGDFFGCCRGRSRSALACRCPGLIGWFTVLVNRSLQWRLSIAKD